jgi:predicted dehydrogenase
LARCPEIAGGGIVLHTGIHGFDLVRFLTGREVVRVRCRTSRIATVRTEDNFAALLDLEGSDAIVTVSGCRATAGRSSLIDAAAAEGQVVADQVLHFAYRVRGLGARHSICRRRHTVQMRSRPSRASSRGHRGAGDARRRRPRAVQIAGPATRPPRTGPSTSALA